MRIESDEVDFKKRFFIFYRFGDRRTTVVNTRTKGTPGNSSTTNAACGIHLSRQKE